MTDFSKYLPINEYQNNFGYDRMNCFPWNAEVLMEDFSLKKISEVKTGDYVITHLGNKKRVTETFKRDYNGEMFEIFVSGLYDPIICTPNHQLLTNFGWKMAKDLTDKDYVIIPTTENIVKDNLIYNIECNKDFLWFLGLYLAEGSLKKAVLPKNDNKNLKVNGSGSNNGMITFSLNKRETYLSDKIIEIGKRLFNTNFNIYLKKDSDCMVVNGNNFWLRELLSELGGEGAGSKNINKRLMSLSPELQKQILIGWLDGDGSYKKTNKGLITGVSISEALIRQMSYICLRNGININLVKRKAYLNHTEAYELRICGEFINKVKDFGYKSKHPKNLYCFDGCVLLKKIKKVNHSKKVYSKNSLTKQCVNRVYNLEVEDDHSYVVNSVAVHNCVTYSILNCFEILFKYKYGQERNFSDRYIAQLSGTTKKGNWLDRVFTTIQEYGLIEESLYPDDAKTWEEYYKDISQNLINEGKEFLNEYKIDCKLINPDRADLIVKALDDTPLQVTVLFATGEGILNPSSNPPGIRNHAVVCYGYKLGEYWLIYDSYAQIIKKYAWDYKFGIILKLLISKKNMSNVKLVKDQDSSAVGFFVPANSPEALISQGLNYGIDIPKTPTGGVDWALVKVEGSVNFK